MSHLSLETIARLVDEQPSALDNAHLEACAACSAELDAMRADVAALADLPGIMPSPDSWSVVSARLQAEGLMKAGARTAAAGVIPLHRTRAFGMLARAAGIAVVFLGGALVGRALQDTPVTPAGQVANAPADSHTPAGAVTDSQNATSDAPVAEPLGTPGTSDRNVRLASENTSSAAGEGSQRGTPANEDDALRALRAAEDRYFNALSSYSQAAGTETSDPTTRLAALEAIVITTRAALGQAPTDPVINGYHLTALAQRDAMLKQIKATPATSW